MKLPAVSVSRSQLYQRPTKLHYYCFAKIWFVGTRQLRVYRLFVKRNMDRLEISRRSVIPSNEGRGQSKERSPSNGLYYPANGRRTRRWYRHPKSRTSGNAVKYPASVQESHSCRTASWSSSSRMLYR